jgi:hypothetical protein
MTSQSFKDAISSGRKIGDLCWYDCENVHITPAELVNLFDQHGLNHKYLPDTIKPKSAFQKACRQAMAKDSSSDNRPSVVKMIVDEIDKIVYGVVDLDVQEQTESIDPEFSDSVWLNKDKLTVHYKKGHPMSLKIEKIFNRLCGEYITRDISRMIVRAMDKMHCVSLRDAGVVYFIPLTVSDELKSLQAVVNSIGNCNMRVFEIGDGNAQSVVGEAKSQINNKIKAMQEDIHDLKLSIEEGGLKGKSAENSIAVRWQRYNDLKEKCMILSDALRVKADILMGDLQSVASLIKSELESPLK